MKLWPNISRLLASIVGGVPEPVPTIAPQLEPEPTKRRRLKAPRQPFGFGLFTVRNRFNDCAIGSAGTLEGAIALRKAANLGKRYHPYAVFNSLGKLIATV